MIFKTKKIVNAHLNLNGHMWKFLFKLKINERTHMENSQTRHIVNQECWNKFADRYICLYFKISWLHKIYLHFYELANRLVLLVVNRYHH
jgi:hypothetical protein